MNELIFFLIPDKCPVCGGETQIIVENNTEVLMCMNEECEGKLLNKLDHFLGKKGLDVKGISKATLEKLMEWGWVNEFADIYTLQEHKLDWIKKPGFGAKSVESILSSIENSREPSLEAFISGLGIPGVGRTLAKDLAKEFTTYEEFRDAAKQKWDFTKLDGVGIEKASNIWFYDFSFADRVAAHMLGYKNAEPGPQSKALEGLTICITGTITKFKNRGELQSFILSHGGKPTTAVSRNTNILINNDVNSTSSKNITAQKLNIPILSEEQFFEKYF